VDLTASNLSNIIEVLRQFAEISGLSCNLEKTALMQIGSLDPIPLEVSALNITITDEITLLGANIKNTGKCYNKNGKIILDFANEIESFVSGNIRIAKNRFYDPPGHGGIGLFNLRNFLASQNCAWIKRSASLDDFWKRELFKSSLGSVFNLRKTLVNDKLNPILLPTEVGKYYLQCVQDPSGGYR
jgi:hypothetical protein